MRRVQSIGPVAGSLSSRLLRFAAAGALCASFVVSAGSARAQAPADDDSIFGDKVKGSTSVKPKPNPAATSGNGSGGEAADPPKRVPAPAVKIAIPASPALAAAEKTVKEAYEADFAGQKPADRVALAKKLIDASKQDGVTPAERYVLLREAANAAAGAGDAALAVSAADAIVKDFFIRAADYKSTLLQNAARGVLAREPDGARLTRSALDVADDLGLAGDYEGASKLAAIAEASSRNAKDDALSAEATPRITEIRRLRNEFVKLAAPSIEKLRTDRNDPASNLKFGRFYCLAVGDWKRGLPCLQKSGDATLTVLANQELAPPADANGRIAVADGWWELAKHEAGPAADRAKRHAQTWYALAEPDVKGITLAKVRQRLEPPGAASQPAGTTVATTTTGAGGGTKPTTGGASSKPAGKAVSLLKGLKGSRDIVAGQWSFVDDGLRSDLGNASRVQLPAEVPAEYDLTMDFTIVSGYGTLTAILPKPDGSKGHMCFGMFGLMFGLQSASGAEGPTMKRIVKPLHFGDRLSMTVKVRKEKVTGLVGNEVLFDTKVDYSDVYGWGQWKLTDPTLFGIGTEQTIVIFHRVTLKAMSGAADTTKK